MWHRVDGRTFINSERRSAVAQHFDGSWFFVTQWGGHSDPYPSAEDAMRECERLAEAVPTIPFVRTGQWQFDEEKTKATA